jgi:hypothetical protein
LPWHEAFDFLDRLRRVVLHDLIGLAQAYMDATLARSSSSSSNSSSNKRAAQAPNASWEQQCLAGQVLPFVVCCLADRRASLSRNSVECLADVFVAAGGQHLKATAVSDWAHTSIWLDCRGQHGRQTQLSSVCLCCFDVASYSFTVLSFQALEPAVGALLDLLGGSATKSLKEAASRALDTAVANVPAR